ncbi:MAG: hypothetical protein MJ060_04265 [Clostridia bacterium]|nr:hypothetical protein [Clostridia bacterium]
MQIAESRGDTAAHNTYKRVFDTKFKQYVTEDRKLDELSAQANIKPQKPLEKAVFWGLQKWYPCVRLEA